MGRVHNEEMDVSWWSVWRAREIEERARGTHLVELVAQVDGVDVVAFEIGEHNDLWNAERVRVQSKCTRRASLPTARECEMQCKRFKSRQ